ncbi:MAG: hypothetical protein RLZZ618_3357 [Pseudomonadota bacterium]|jgi:predicted porin
MKKTLIALAALAAGTSALAQSTVTIYGRIDQGIGQNVDAVKNREVRAGSTNRIGFRGTEDLGGGLKAFFHIEHRFNADEGTQIAGSPFWEGKSIVGLQSQYGTVFLGRDDNPAYLLSQKVSDPWDTDTVANNNAITNGGVGTSRYANSVNYRGTFSGFTVAAQVTERDGTKAQSTGPDRPFSLGLSYVGGPLSVGFGHENPANENAQWTTVNAAWNFQVVRVIGLFGTGNLANDNKIRSVLLGVTAPLGAGELRASYGIRDNRTTNVKLNKKLGLGYHHALSKRTTLYVDVANERRDNMASNLVKTGWDLGVKHNF